MTALIDCHFHLDESIVSLQGLLASMDTAGIERTALIPAMCPDLTLPWKARGLLPTFRRTIHGRPGWLHRRAVWLYRSAVKGKDQVDVLGRLVPIFPQPDNDAVLRAVAQSERFLGWVFVNPAGGPDPVAEAERCMATDRMIGIKAHPHWHDYPVHRLKDVAALCAEKGWPMLIHLGSAEHGDFRLLPESFPGLRVIYAHAGIPYGRAVWEYARQREGVFVDLSSSVYVDQRTARRAVAVAGADRCLFGSDGPYLHVAEDRFDYRCYVRQLEALPLDDDERERIGGSNFWRAVRGG